MKDSQVLQSFADKVILNVTVAARARATELCGVFNKRLKIRLAAPPVDGKANAALREFLSQKLGVPKTHISILRGETSKDKTIEILGVTLPQVTQALDLTEHSD